MRRSRSAWAVAAAAVATLSLTACSFGGDSTAAPTLIGLGNGDVSASATATAVPTTSPAADPSPSDAAGGAAADPNAAASPTKAVAAAASRATPKASARATVRVTVKVTPKATPTTTPKASASPSPSASPSAAAAVTAALAAEAAAVRTATSAKVVGTVVAGGLRYSVDLRLGPNADGTLTYDLGTIAIRRVDKGLYISPDDAFFTNNGHPELVATYKDKWIQIDPADPSYAGIVSLTNLSTWTRVVGAAPARTVAAATLNGVAVKALSGGTGNKANTVYLAATGPALPQSVVSADKVDSIVFSGWGSSAPSVTAPSSLVDEPADSVLDVSSFAAGTAAAFSAIWKA